MRRRHTLNAPAFLIDQDRRITPQDAPEFRCQSKHLRLIDNVSLEEDQTPGLRFAKEGALVRGERCAFTAADEGSRHG